MLTAYRGYLQADAYAGFDALYKDGRILEVGCWAHARRKFFEIAEAAPKDTRTAAHDALDWIAQLYMIERAIAGEPPDKKCTLRQEQSAPVLAEFRTWLEGTLRSILPPDQSRGRAAAVSLEARRLNSAFPYHHQCINAMTGITGRLRLLRGEHRLRRRIFQAQRLGIDS